MLSGGAGADRFVLEFAGGPDTAVDFTPGVDVIVLQGFGSAAFFVQREVWHGLLFESDDATLRFLLAGFDRGDIQTQGFEIV